MSDFIADILTQNGKLSASSESKDQSISRVMKGKYDFEKFLLDSNDNCNDIATYDAVLNNHGKDINKYNVENEFIKNEVMPLTKNTEAFHADSRLYGVLNSEVITLNNDIKNVVSKFFDQQYGTTTPTAKKDNLNLDISTKDRTQFFKVSYQNIVVTEDDNIRLIKSESGYKLYLNIDEPGLTESKIISVLKFIESDKNIRISKVILNRELIFNKNYKSESDSEATSKYNSKINIKI